MSWISDVRFELERLEVSAKKLRNFGLVTGGIFLAIAVWIFFRKHVEIPAYCLGGAALLLMAAGGFAPLVLGGIYRVWMGLAFAMGWIVSRVVLTILFYLVLMPIGWIARLAGEDFLDIRRPKEKNSCWVRRSDAKSDLEKMF